MKFLQFKSRNDSLARNVRKISISNEIDQGMTILREKRKKKISKFYSFRQVMTL